MGSNPTSRTIHFAHAASRETRIGPPGARKISLGFFDRSFFDMLSSKHHFLLVCFRELDLRMGFPDTDFKNPETLVSIEPEIELALLCRE